MFDFEGAGFQASFPAKKNAKNALTCGPIFWQAWLSSERSRESAGSSEVLRRLFLREGLLVAFYKFVLRRGCLAPLE